MNENFRQAIHSNQGCAVILAGSDSDKPHIDKIIKSLDKHKIPYEVRICSAHKQPEKLMEMIHEYNSLGSSITFIAVAGGTDALSGTLSFHAMGPVISCPPDAPNETCLKNPPGSSNAYIARPENVGRFVAQIYVNVNPIFKDLLRETISKKVESLQKKDIEFREGDKGITQEVLNNTLKKEIYPEINVVSTPKMGKVRIVYDIGNSHMIMISSDALSTHDVVHKRQVYGKGENLDAISSYYFKKTEHIIPNHFVKNLAPNTWLVKKAEPILIEMIFRRYLTGSGWRAYVKENGPENGMVFCGVHLRPGYRKNEILDQLIFTPTAKGQVKDFAIPEFEGVDPEKDDPPITVDIIKRNYIKFGLRRPEDLDILVDLSFKLYNFIYSDLESKGYLLADTKWEFGYLPDGTIGLIDECVTPDSSRFWDKENYKFNPSKNEFSMLQGDKQPFRDYIESLGLHTKEKKAELAEHWMDDNVLKEGVIRYNNIRKIITGTNAEITTEPRKQVILDALRKEGYLKSQTI